MTPLPADQAVRDRVVRDFDTTFLVEAGAGTGKTTVLVSRILALVKTGRATLDRIVAITFTEKAAGELKLRLREGMEDALDKAKDEKERGRLQTAATDLERAPVSTIHAFAQALLKERPFEAGLDPGFQVAAEIAGERVLDDAWDAWFDTRMAEADDTLLRALTLGLKIEDLRKAALTMAAERDVLRQPVKRPPFTPASLRDRLREAVATLKPLKQRCTNAEDDAYQPIERLEAFLTRTERADGLALERLNRELDVVAHRGQQGNWSPKDACREAKAELKALKDAQAQYVTASNADLAWALRDRLCSFLEGYEALKREHALVEYADLLLKARDVLLRHTPVRNYFQKRFDFLVDEFQDTDPLQAQIAFLLAEDPKEEPAADWRGVRLAPGKLFVVGDPKQSIYRFRRADIAIYNEVKRRIVTEANGGEVLPLTANLRPIPSVLELRAPGLGRRQGRREPPAGSRRAPPPLRRPNPCKRPSHASPTNAAEPGSTPPSPTSRPPTASRPTAPAPPPSALTAPPREPPPPSTAPTPTPSAPKPPNKPGKATARPAAKPPSKSPSASPPPASSSSRPKRRRLPQSAKSPAKPKPSSPSTALNPSPQLLPRSPHPSAASSTPFSASRPAGADLSSAARALTLQFGLSEDDATAAADIASRARTLPEIAAAETADLLYRELPFAVPMGDGLLATGKSTWPIATLVSGPSSTSRPPTCPIPPQPSKSTAPKWPFTDKPWTRSPAQGSLGHHHKLVGIAAEGSRPSEAVFERTSGTVAL